jgi:DNA-binding PadR family transcriptional regulator
VERLTGEIVNSLLSVRVLLQARSGPICGRDLADMLARAGSRAAPSVLYALLHALRETGDLEPDGLRSGRRYYRITRRGRTTLTRAQRDMQHIASALAPDLAAD